MKQRCWRACQKRHPHSTPSATRNGHEQGSFTSLIACWKRAAYIDPATAQAAKEAPVRIRPTNPIERVRGDYATEMVRQAVVAQYGEEAYTRGLNITTTIRSSEQQMAYRALRAGLMDFERRQHYRGS